jgi:hypothetical protein
MTSIFQSCLAVLVGLALSIYGIVHCITRYPGPEAFRHLVDSLPVVGAVLLFALGIAAAVVGALVLVLSFRRLQRNWRAVQMLTSQRRAYMENGDDREWAYNR